MSVAPLFCIACDVTADTAIGTSDSGLARRVAVTMMLTFSESTADPLSCAHATGTLLPNAMAPTEISQRLFFIMLLPLPQPRAFASRRNSCRTMMPTQQDRKSVVWGESGSVRVELGGERSIKKKQKN